MTEFRVPVTEGVGAVTIPRTLDIVRALEKTRGQKWRSECVEFPGKLSEVT